MFGMFGPKTKEDAIKKILKYQSEPRMYSDVVPYEKEIRQLKDKFNIDDGEIEQARKKKIEKENEEMRRREGIETERSYYGGRKSRKMKKSRKSKKSRKMRGKGCGCGRMNCPYCCGRTSCACPYRR
jgi:hypothetical protein